MITKHDETLLELALEFEFPNIKGLNVKSYSGKIHITFEDTGEYSKEQVENFLNKFKTNSHDTTTRK